MRFIGALNGGFWPTAEVRQGEYRGGSMPPKAAGHAFRVIISATDPKRPHHWYSNQNSGLQCVRPITEYATPPAYPEIIGVVAYSDDFSQTSPLARAAICEKGRANMCLVVSCGRNSLCDERVSSGAGQQRRAPSLC